MKSTMVITIFALTFTIAASQSSMRPAQQSEKEFVTIDTLSGQFDMSIDSTGEPFMFKEFEFFGKSIGQRQSRFSDSEAIHDDPIAEQMREDQIQDNDDNFLGLF